MFLSKPEYFAVKLESEPVESECAPSPMFQCSMCKAVLLDRDEAIAHVLSSHMDMFYATEEITVDPPKGNFLCVAQCRLTGELLGPPNYHGYNERVSEMRRSRFSHMSLEDYRKHIINRTEKELVEKWRTEVSRERRYSTLRTATPESFSNLRDVEAHFRRFHADDVIRETLRFIIPGVIGLRSNGGAIAEAISMAWQHNRRRPTGMEAFLASAFRRAGLHVFKARDKIVHASAIRPNPIVASNTESRMRSILETLSGAPARGRMELLARFLPGASSDSSEAAEFISRLCWLIDRGHVIEFADGMLSVAQPENNAKRNTGNDARRNDHG